MAKLHWNIRVEGRVQGVWYRASTKEKAEQLGLCGFVKNEADGSVYIEAEGTKEQLAELNEWCYVGPPLANVTNVILVEDSLQNFNSFEIVR